jgi:hypothetical protein
MTKAAIDVYFIAIKNSLPLENIKNEIIESAKYEWGDDTVISSDKESVTLTNGDYVKSLKKTY